MNVKVYVVVRCVKVGKNKIEHQEKKCTKVKGIWTKNNEKWRGGKEHTQEGLPGLSGWVR